MFKQWEKLENAEKYTMHKNRNDKDNFRYR